MKINKKIVHYTKDKYKRDIEQVVELKIINNRINVKETTTYDLIRLLCISIKCNNNKCKNCILKNEKLLLSYLKIEGIVGDQNES